MTYIRYWKPDANGEPETFTRTRWHILDGERPLCGYTAPDGWADEVVHRRRNWEKVVGVCEDCEEVSGDTDKM